ncbi:hypothetical protein F4802DRAFT_588267 [Xylaria palmicola]|nr:hypothetical protein F4802DRAFT_588267 [Xylaria palmicola]
MSATNPVSPIGSEAAAPAPDTAQHNESTPSGVGTAGDRPTALIDAMEDGDGERAQSILNGLREADRNDYVTVKKGPRSTLHYAIHFGLYDLVPQLIEYARDKAEFVTRRGSWGSWSRTTLHMAAGIHTRDIDKDTRSSLIRHLIEAISDENAKNTYITRTDDIGATPLHRAAGCGCLEIVGYLLENATNVDVYLMAKDINGMTALHYAARTGHHEVVDYLLTKVTNLDTYITAKTNAGWTALLYAACGGHPNVVSHLLDKATNLEATELEDYLTAETDDGWTALHYAASEGWLEAVKRFVTLSNNSEGYVKMTSMFLLINGAELRITNKNKMTAWDLASTPNYQRWKFLAALLLWEADTQYLEGFRLRDEEINSFERNVAAHLYLIGKGVQLPTTSMNQINARLCGIVSSLYGSTQDRCSENIDVIEALAAILEEVHKEFRQMKEARRPNLRSREPSCVIRNLTLGNSKSCEFISLVMPCICVENWAVINQRINIYDEETKFLKSSISNCRNSLESYIPNTLDEYCNPSLPKEILDAHNEDQVLGRYEKKKRETATPSSDGKEHHRSLLYELWMLVKANLRELSQFVVDKKPQEEPRQTVKPTNVILVRQAWIWKIGEELCMTELSPEWPDPFELRCKWKDPKRQIAAYLGEVVGHLDNPIGEEEGSLLRIYENALIAISEEAKQYTESAHVADIDLDKEKDIFHQISDLREELAMIKSVLTQQEEVWFEFLRLAWPNQGQDPQASRHSYTDSVSGLESSDSESNFEGAARDREWKETLQSGTKFAKYKQRMEKLDKDAERVEKKISTLLDLKQKHATMREAHSTALLSATVFGFTVITVIFAPLAFVAALFALPIDEFNKGKEGNNKDGAYSSSYIGKWSVTAELVSIAVTLLAMWAGVRFAGLHVWGKRGLREYIRQKANALPTEENNRHENNGDKNSRDEYYTDEDYTDEDSTDEGNRESINEAGTSTEVEKGQQRDGLGTRLRTVFRNRHISGVRKRTNDVEWAEQ